MVRKGRSAPPPIQYESSGQPTKYRSEMCQQVEQLGREGLTRNEIAQQLNISYSSLKNYMRDYEEFYKSMDKAMTYSQAYHMDMARTALRSGDKSFNWQGFRLLMMFGFGYSENAKVTEMSMHLHGSIQPKEPTFNYDQAELEKYLEELVRLGIDPLKSRTNRVEPDLITTEEETQITDAVLLENEDDIKIISESSGGRRKGRQVSRFKAIN